MKLRPRTEKSPLPKEIPLRSRYRVKFPHPDTGEETYGVIESNTQRHGIAAQDGFCIISHALTPAQFKVRLSAVEDVEYPFRYDYKEGYGIIGDDEYSRYVWADLVRAKQAELELPSKDRHLHVGNTFFLILESKCKGAPFQTHYIVTKIIGDKCYIEWRGWHVVRCRDNYFDWGGLHPTNTILPLVRISKDRIEFDKEVGGINLTENTPIGFA